MNSGRDISLIINCLFRSVSCRKRAIALCSLMVLGAIHWNAIQVEAADKPWTDLFNKRDLSGWFNVNCAPGTWSVREGMIISTGVPTGILRTDRQYENFELELEYRHMKAGGNAGLFV